MAAWFRALSINTPFFFPVLFSPSVAHVPRETWISPTGNICSAVKRGRIQDTRRGGESIVWIQRCEQMTVGSYNTDRTVHSVLDHSMQRSLLVQRRWAHVTHILWIHVKFASGDVVFCQHKHQSDVLLITFITPVFLTHDVFCGCWSGSSTCVSEINTKLPERLRFRFRLYKHSIRPEWAKYQPAETNPPGWFLPNRMQMKQNRSTVILELTG